MFFVVRTVGRGSRDTGQAGGGAAWLKLWGMCFLLAFPIAGIAALFHAVDHHAPPAPIAELVTFDPGTYSGYAAPSFEVDATNGNAAAMTVHSVTVEFTNAETGQEITTVTEHTDVTIQPGGWQSQAFTWPAPKAVVNTAIEDKFVQVTVTGWS